MSSTHGVLLSVVALATLPLHGCGPTNEGHAARSSQRSAGSQDPDVGTESTRAVAVLRPVGESGVTGSIHLEKTDEGIHVHGEIRGLTPGQHGFHIHQFGDLSAADDGSSAGGHFAPDGHDHGAPEDQERHVGDLGNIEADDSGTARVDKVDGRITLSGANSVLGRAVVVHADADTFGGESGDAGSRVAFGVIGIAEGD